MRAIRGDTRQLLRLLRVGRDREDAAEQARVDALRQGRIQHDLEVARAGRLDRTSGDPGRDLEVGHEQGARRRGLDGATVAWRRAPAFEALEALERGDADLAIGGFTKAAVTAHQGAANSYAYFTEALVVAAEPGTPLPDELDGQKVHAAPALLADGLIVARDGVPVSAEAEGVRLVALPDWQLPARELVATGIVLRRDEHVLAAPPGENAWLMRLERFLRQQAGTMDARLRAQAR
jgi:polar amino acid transport system substrate-binding protein